MAEGGPRALTAAFPPPPPFWKEFTAENVEKLEKIKREAAKSHGDSPKKKWSQAELRTLDVPPELRHLIPPEPPKSGSYSVFGETQSVREHGV
jgi:mediator of RNA polymerase II transcription subunit 7